MESYDKPLNIVSVQINEQRLDRENVEPKVVERDIAS